MPVINFRAKAEQLGVTDDLIDEFLDYGFDEYVEELVEEIAVQSYLRGFDVSHP